MEKGRSWPSFHIPDDIDTPYLTKALLLTAGKLKLGSIDFQKGGSKETETEKKKVFYETCDTTKQKLAARWPWKILFQ